MNEDEREELSELEEDIIVLALRLYGEDPQTFSPECDSVMKKYRSIVEERLNGAV